MLIEIEDLTKRGGKDKCHSEEQQRLDSAVNEMTDADEFVVLLWCHRYAPL